MCIQNDAFIRWFKCTTSKSGARTVGTCAHAVSVLWYLGYARHETDIQYPSMKLFAKVKDARNRSSNDL